MKDHPIPLPRHIAWFAPWTWKRRWWVAGAVALLYPLSIGPIATMVMYDYLPVETLSLYAPLYSVGKLHPILNQLLFWYIDLFDPLLGTPFPLLHSPTDREINRFYS